MIYNKLLLILIMGLLTIPLLSQDDSTKVAFVAYWSVGDSYDFRITKSKQNWKKDILVKNEHQSYISTFKVVDETDTSYTINWSYETDLENNFFVPAKLLERFSKYKTTEIKYRTSELGRFLEVLNWREVSDIMNNMFDDILEIVGENDNKKQEYLKNVLLPFKQMYSSKQGIEVLVLKELQYFHFPMGMEFDITEPYTYDEVLPNMLGGNPLNAIAIIYFEDVDFENGTCIMKQELSLDPVSTKIMLTQLFTRMKLNNYSVTKALETAVFKVDDINTFKYYFNPGIPIKIESKREFFLDINNETATGVEKTIIELISLD